VKISQYLGETAAQERWPGFGTLQPDLDVRIIAAHAGGSLLGSLCGKGEGVVMAGVGSVFRRCGCTDPATGRRYGRACPRLAAVGRHGSWHVRLELPSGLDGAPWISRPGSSVGRFSAA